MSSNPAFQVRSHLGEQKVSEIPPHRRADGGMLRSRADMERPAFHAPRAMPDNCARMDASLWQLYYQVEALRSDDSPYVLQIVSAADGSGSTTVAQGYALAAAAESEGPVLMLSCNGLARHEPSIAEGDEDEAEPVAGVPNLYVASLGHLHHGRSPASAVWATIEQFKERFVVIVLDCSSINGSPLPLGLCKHCDGTVLVVEAERDRRSEARASVAKIERFGGVPLGVVLNKTRPHLPAWLDRLLD